MSLFYVYSKAACAAARAITNGVAWGITFRSDLILVRQAAVLQRLLQDVVLPGARGLGARGNGGVAAHGGFQRRQLRYHAVHGRTHVSLGRDAGGIGFRGLGGGFLNKRGDPRGLCICRMSESPRRNVRATKQSQVQSTYLRGVRVHSLYVAVQAAELLEDARAVGARVRGLTFWRIVHSEYVSLQIPWRIGK